MWAPIPPEIPTGWDTCSFYISLKSNNQKLVMLSPAKWNQFWYSVH